MNAVAPIKEISDLVKAKGGISAELCYQCGICDSVCPWNRVTHFSIRKIVRQAVFGLTEIESEDLWRCTSCGTCPPRCPRGVNQIELIVSLRRIATEYGVFPESITPIITVTANLLAEGNPFGFERAKRADWARDLPVKPFTEGMEYLYFPGCYLSYDPRMKKVAAATAAVLDKAGVEFGILGPEENCCGESIRKTGNEDAFKQLAKRNIKSFIDHGVKKILVSSPHCLQTLRNEYPEFRAHFEVIHIAELLGKLLAEGTLRPSKTYQKKITYHDPCYLGRHNGVFEAPRQVLKDIPGVLFNEMQDHRENSLCCGGGGGRVWMETKKGERFSDLRLEQAAKVGAEVLVTACPSCITMLTDSSLGLPAGQMIEVKDMTEVLQQVL